MLAEEVKLAQFDAGQPRDELHEDTVLVKYRLVPPVHGGYERHGTHVDTQYGDSEGLDVVYVVIRHRDLAHCGKLTSKLGLDHKMAVLAALGRHSVFRGYK